MTASPTLAAARAYIQRGIAVFPILAAGTYKAPATDNGLKDASTDPSDIERWWSQNPTYNVGIATGAPAGFWVLDVDGPEGAATLSALEAQHGALPETPEQTTARGRHICFAYDPARPIRNSASRVGPKIDVRGDGGYIVAAPSRHQSGVTYQWHADRRPSKIPFAVAPEWLIDLAEKKPAPKAAPADRPAPKPSAPAKPGDKLLTAYGEKILREECEKIATAVDGTVNETLNRCSFNIGTIVGAGEIAEHIARAALIDAGMKVVKPPWTIIQISEHVERAMTDGMQHPRQKPDLPPRPPQWQPAPAREARATQQERPIDDQAPPAQSAEIIDIRDPARGYTPETSWELQLIRNEDGRIVARTQNVILLCQHHADMAGVLAFDDFADAPMIERRPPWEENDGTEWKPRPMSDNDVTWLVAWLEQHGLAMKSPAVHAAAMAVAKRAAYNPAVDWLCEQQWDGKPRLDSWLEYYLGAEAETEGQRSYVSAVGRKWLIGAVARIMRPGCKMDTMLILEGEQGIGKSRAAKILGTFGSRNYFTDELSDIGSKDAAMQLSGVAIVELAELDKFSKADINTLKAWLTRTTDRYRPPYGRMLVEAPRHSVLIGTMNPSGHGYLEDPTGGRRFWPVTVKAIDQDGLAADQAQLWAEAVAAWRAGEPWWLTDDALIDAATTEQSARYAEDPWGELIDNYVGILNEVTLEQLRGDGCLKIPADKRTTMLDRRIGRHLRERGWIRNRKWNPRLKVLEWIYIRGEQA